MPGTINSADDLQIFTRTGTVIKCETWSATHVHGSSQGGGGYVGPQGGHVSAPTVSVSSSVTEEYRMFIREDDGTEFETRFHNLAFGFREGHRVTVIYAGAEAFESGFPGGLINHTTRKKAVFYKQINRMVAKLHERNPGLWQLLFWVALVGGGFIGGKVVFWLTNSWWISIVLGIVAGGAAVFAAFQPGKSRADQLERDVAAKLDSLVETCMNSEEAERPAPQ